VITGHTGQSDLPGVALFFTTKYRRGTMLHNEILVELQDRKTHYERSNILLLSLIDGVKRRANANRCFSLLRAAFDSKLAYFARKFSQSEAESAFGRAVEDYPMHRTNRVASRLVSMTRRYLKEELGLDASQQKLSKTLSRGLLCYSMSELLSGEAAHFTREEAVQALAQFVAARLIYKKEIPIVMNRFFPSRRGTSPAMRQRNHRAFIKLRERIRKRLKGRCV
jgi:hypothetical protein